MSNSIRSITEDKLVAYLQTHLPTLTINKGVTSDIRTLPMAIVHAETSAKPSAFGADNLGNYRVGVKVYVYSSADDETLQAHRDRVEAILGHLTDIPAVQAAWSGSEGSLYSIRFETDQEGMSQRRYGNSLSFTLYAVLEPQT